MAGNPLTSGPVTDIPGTGTSLEAMRRRVPFA